MRTLNTRGVGTKTNIYYYFDLMTYKQTARQQSQPFFLEIRNYGSSFIPYASGVDRPIEMSGFSP